MRRSLLTSLLALLLAAALVGCGASGGDDDAGGGEGDTATPEAKIESLADAMPTDEEVGGDYVRLPDDTGSEDDDTGSDDDPTDDDPFEDACPALSELEFLQDDDENPDEIVAGWQVTDDEREIEVSLDPTASDLTEDQMDQLVDAINECGTVTMEDDGTEMDLTMSAEAVDDHGDFGMQMDMSMEFTVMGLPFAVDFRGIAFSRDGVGVFVSASSGFAEDPTTGEPQMVPADVELVDELAGLIDGRVSTLGD